MGMAICIPALGIATTMYSIPRTARAPRGSHPGHVSAHTVIRHHPFVVWFALYALCMGSSISGAGAYMPLYAYDELGFGVRMAGLVGSIVGLTGIPARLFWGRTVEHRRESLAQDMLVVSIGSVLSAAAVYLATDLGPLFLWAGAVGLGAVASGWQVIAMMSAIRDLPAERTAAGTGVIQMGFLLGLLSGPLIFGAAHEHFGHYRYGWLAVGAGFVCAALLVVISWFTDRRGAIRTGRLGPTRTEPTERRTRDTRVRSGRGIS
jgi:MFS family permease